MKRARFLVSIDGCGLSKPTTTRAKAERGRRWWLRRCPGLPLDVERVRAPSPA